MDRAAERDGGRDHRRAALAAARAEVDVGAEGEVALVHRERLTQARGAVVGGVRAAVARLEGVAASGERTLVARGVGRAGDDGRRAGRARGDARAVTGVEGEVHAEARREGGDDAADRGLVMDRPAPYTTLFRSRRAALAAARAEVDVGAEGEVALVHRERLTQARGAVVVGVRAAVARLEGVAASGDRTLVVRGVGRAGDDGRRAGGARGAARAVT